jgi:protein subunit release factor B
MKELLFSLSKDKGDFIVEAIKHGGGAGGQKKNKTSNACRITHPKSGAIAECHEERHFAVNKKTAFEKLTQSDKFQKWLKVEIAKKNGAYIDIEEKVNKAMSQVKVEVHNEKGQWTDDERYFENDN